MERKGIATERGNMNREIAVANGLIAKIVTRIKLLKERLVPKTPTLKEAVYQLDDARQKLKQIDAKIAQAKQDRDVDEWDELVQERRGVWREYSKAKELVRVAEKAVRAERNGHVRVREMER
jgi:hypothetical protein